ncbi:MAG: glycosyltransferase family 2 protein [Isosphaerales bacterium]
MDDPLLILCLASALISVVAAVHFLAAVRRWSRSLPSASIPGRAVRLTVIIPARDEEQDIAVALHSVLAQQDVDLEIIVVNDHSSDRTGEIADAIAVAEPRLRVIHNPELPLGWLGKCNAMQRAAAVATGDVLLFTDADIVQYGMIWAGRRIFRFRPLKALLFPLVVVPVICCMARALYLYTHHGAVHWRGRTIRVRTWKDEG